MYYSASVRARTVNYLNPLQLPLWLQGGEKVRNNINMIKNYKNYVINSFKIQKKVINNLILIEKLNNGSNDENNSKNKNDKNVRSYAKKSVFYIKDKSKNRNENIKGLFVCSYSMIIFFL